MIKEQYGPKYILEVLTLSNKTFTPLFNVQKVEDNDDVLLERSLNSPDVDFVDSLVEEGHYKLVSLVDEPFMQHRVDKYDQETNTCKRHHLLCSIPTTAAAAGVDNQNDNVTMIKSCCYGFVIDLLMHFTKRLNFKFEIKMVEDNKYGNYIPEKGTYNGMVGEVLNGKADMALHAIGITYQRSNYVDFTGPFIRSDVSFFLPKQMPKYDYFMFHFISHIDSNAVYACIGLYLAVTLLLYVCDNTTGHFKTISETASSNTELQTRTDQFQNIKDKSQASTRKKNSLREIFSHYIFNDCFLYMGGLVFQRGIGGKAPKTMSGKVLAQIFGFVMVIVTTVYTATLTAHAVSNQDGDSFLGLKDPRVSKPFHSIQLVQSFLIILMLPCTR